MNRIFGILIIALLIFGIASCNDESTASAKDQNKTTSVEQNQTEPENNEVLTLEGDHVDEANMSSKGYGKVRVMNTNEFLDEIFDYNAHPDKWVYKGDKPAIIDFYATWCGPCKKVAPIMDELAEEYAGKVNFFKIDTDKESTLAGQVFRIRSIPSILYIPVNGQPLMYKGLMAKADYIRLIKENLLK